MDRIYGRDIDMTADELREKVARAVYATEIAKGSYDNEPEPIQEHFKISADAVIRVVLEAVAAQVKDNAMILLGLSERQKEMGHPAWSEMSKIRYEALMETVDNILALLSQDKQEDAA